MSGIGKWVCGFVLLWLLVLNVAEGGIQVSSDTSGDAAVRIQATADSGTEIIAVSSANPGWWPVALLGIYCVLIVLASLGGGWLPMLMSLTHNRMQLMLSLVGGLMLGIGLFHMLPHAVHEMHSLDRAVWWMMAGMLTMFFLIRLFHFHQHEPPELADVSGALTTESHDHDHDHDHDQHHDHDHDHGGHGHHHHHQHSHELGWLGIALGLSLHTLIDGIALGASVTAASSHSTEWQLLGLGTFLAIALHKPLDAVSITSLMLSGGWSARARHAVNAGFALMCPLGAFLFVLGVDRFAGNQSVVIGCALAFSAGVFLCISLGDLLPEMEFHSHNRLRLSVALIAGIALAWGIRYLEPGHLHTHEAGEAVSELETPSDLNVESRTRNVE